MTVFVCKHLHPTDKNFLLLLHISQRCTITVHVHPKARKKEHHTTAHSTCVFGTTPNFMAIFAITCVNDVVSMSLLCTNTMHIHAQAKQIEQQTSQVVDTDGYIRML